MREMVEQVNCDTPGCDGCNHIRKCDGPGCFRDTCCLCGGRVGKEFLCPVCLGQKAIEVFGSDDLAEMIEKRVKKK